MDRERFQRVKQLFSDAIALGASKRGAFLERACGEDRELRAEVDELLQHAGAAGTRFLGATATADAPSPTIGSVAIPGFELLRRIAVGASGIVHRARQLDPPRDVAIKLLRLDGLGPDGVRRFRREAEILAALNHPGIAKVYGAGVAGAGAHQQPWIAMEFVHGETLEEHVRATRPSVHHVLELACGLCNAIGHAHQRGFVHRDLKPSNVMISRDGESCVLDFGVARVLSDSTERGADVTRSGALIGTLAYMAPEQARGERDELDASADVYSLGVMLFELLCGRLPLEIDDVDFLDAVRTLNEDDAPRLRQLRPDLPPDLDAIVGKCLEKAPKRRYANAGELGADLANLLAERPVKARRPTVGYQTRKFIVRHRVLTVAACGVILTLSASLIVTLRGLRMEQRALERTSEALDFFAGKLSELRLALGFGQDQRPLLEAIEVRMRQQLEIDPNNRTLNAALARTLTDLAWLDQALRQYASQFAHAEEALRIRKRMVAEDPGDVDSWTHLSEIYAKLGESVRDRGDPPGGDAWFARALEVDERLVRDYPNDFELLEDLGWSLERVSQRALELGDTARWRELIERRFADAERIVAREPRTWKYAFNFSHALTNMADLRSFEGRVDEARKLELESVREARLAFDLRPQQRDVVKWFVEKATSAAKACSLSGDHANAWPLIEEALTVAEHAVSDEPSRTGLIELLQRTAEAFVPVAQRAEQPRGPERAAEALRRVAPLVRRAADPSRAAQMLEQADRFDPPAERR